MFINKLFTPKWKHKNPHVRKQALLSLNAGLEESQKIFTEVVNTDAEINLRRFAISRLQGIDCVQTLRNSDIEYLLVEDLTKRLCELLAGAAVKGAVNDYEYCCKKLDEIGEARLIDYVAHHGSTVQLRNYALAKIESESVLADIAVSDEDENIRKTALQRVTSTSALERIIKNVRRKDKQICSLAQQKLEAQQQQHAQQLEQQKTSQHTATHIIELVQLCVHSQEWQKNESRLRELFDTWDTINEQAKGNAVIIAVELREAVKQALVTFQQGLEEQKTKQAANAKEAQLFEPVFEKMQQVCAIMANKVAELRQQEAPSEDYLTEVGKFTEQMDEQWRQLKQQYRNHSAPNQSIKQHYLDYSSRYEGLVSEFLIYRKDADTLGKYIASLNKLTQQAAALLKKAGPITGAELETLKNQYSTIKVPSKIVPPGALQKRFEELLKELKELQQQQTSRQKARVAELKTLTTQLQEAIASGKTKHATHLSNRGKKLFKELSAQESKVLQKQGVTSSFQQAVNKVKELSDWCQWSNKPVKEQLCESMELLVEELQAQQQNADYDYNAAVQQIKQARHEWRSLSVGETDAGEQLWERFDQACNNAYAPCQQHFDQQAEYRQLNYEKREKVCQELEQYHQKITRQARELIDWKAMTKILQAARQEWRQLGAVNRSEKDKINTRFKDIISQIENINREEKQNNQEKKQLLIKRAKSTYASIAEGKQSLDEAIELVKRLQADWKEVGSSTKDKQLWDEFRQVCGEVFAQRQAEFDVIKQARDEENSKRKAMCEEIERIAQLSGEALRQSRSTIQRLIQDWQALPKLKKHHGLERRFQSACQAYEKQDQKRVSGTLRLTKQRISHNAQACYQLEKAVFEYLENQCDLDTLVALAEKTQQAWRADAHNTNAVDKAVTVRLTSVLDWVQRLQEQDKASVVNEINLLEADVLRKKEELCLKVELLANIDSPPDKKQARMEYQVSQLAAKMQQHEQLKPDEELQRLLIDWHQAGIISAESNNVLENRFYTAALVVDKDYQCEI